MYQTRNREVGTGSPRKPFGRNSLQRTVLASCIAAAATSLQAQDSKVEEIVVTSSLIPIPLRQIGTSVSVLDEFDIDARGNLSLVDVLRQMPAIGSSNSGGPGQTTSLRIRGEEGFRTLTILDGIRLLDPSGPQIGPQIEHIISDGIGRVEVLRGPQGLAYGADAGGVVNISTRSQSDPFYLNLDGQTGAFGTRQIAANLGGDAGAADYFLSLTDFSTDGFNAQAADTVLADDDGYDNATIHARVGVDLSDDWRLEAVHRDVDSESQFDGCFSGTTVYDCLATFDQSASRLRLAYSDSGQSHSLAYNFTDTERDNLVLGVSSFGSSGELERIEYVGSLTELSGFDLVFGADLEEVSNNGRERDNVGVYAEYLSDFSDSLFITAGLRHDDNDDFGNNTSYRVSVAHLIPLADGELKLRAAAGSGFRAPSPFEIEYNAGSFAFPPASDVVLSQEASQGWELGVEYNADGLSLSATYFDQQVEDAIFFDLSGFSGYLQDVGTSSSEGVELTADVMLTETLRATANYTYNDTERPDGTQRLRRPENLFNLGLSYLSQDQRLSLNAFLRNSRDSLDSVGGVATALEDFNVVDLTASYRISDGFRVYGRIENAFDEDYQEIVGFNSADRAAYVGVQCSFSAN